VILRGVLDYAGHPVLFANAYEPVSNFIVRMLQGSFPRDRRFDEEAVRGFSRLLQDRVRAQDRANAVDFADRLLGDIGRGLKIDPAMDPSRFGAGRFNAVRRLPEVVGEVFGVVSELVRADSGLAVNLRSSGGSLEQFQTNAMRLLGLFLDVTDIEAQTSALAGLQRVVDQAGPRALTDAQVVVRLDAYSQRKIDNLHDEQRTRLARLFVTIGERSDELRSHTLAALNRQAAMADGKSRPFWDVILDKEQIDAIVASTPREGRGTPEEINFLRSVIASDGPRGRSPDSARRAIAAYQRLLAAEDPVAVRDGVAALREAAQQSGYPVVMRDADRAAQALSRQ
jgi:hypothetical protein